jgi:hypothetical protein
MTDWKHVPTISTNTFALAKLGNQSLRLAFGETLSKPEDASFHCAVLIDPEGARLLVKLIQECLAQTKRGTSGTGEGGGASVVLGSTSLH